MVRNNYFNLNYRPEIDGIRAIAVILVFFFHLEISYFELGFFGVDIFFVISGYLITFLLIKNSKNKNFFKDFYFRRARRLLPAFLVVVLITSFFTYIFYLPYDLRDFGQSILAATTFWSNILFFIESGYFENTSKVKPLLHTWSLSVEEQFYIIFSLLFFLIYKKKLISKNFILILFFLSLFLSQFSGYMISDETNIKNDNFLLNQSIYFSFYSPLGRFWEFLFGSIIAIYQSKKLVNKTVSSLSKNILSLVGFIFILLIFFFDKENVISPSFFLFLPLFGVFLLIFFADASTIIGKFLSQKVLVFIGKISYSIYLIHFPIIILAKYNNFDITNKYKLLIFFIVIFFSYLSWRYIEKPFRNKKVISNKNFLFILSPLFFLIIIIGLTFHFTNGLEKSYVNRINDKEKIEYSNIKKLFKSEKKNIYSNKNFECKTWESEINQQILKKFNKCADKYRDAIVVLGDSHALDVFNSLSRVTSEKFVFGIGKPGCRVFSQKKCDYNQYAKFMIDNKDNINVVLFVHQGNYYLLKNRFFKINKKVFDITDNYLNTLSKHVTTVWFGFNVEPRVKPIYLIKKNNIDRFENRKIYDLENYLKNKSNDNYIYFSRIDLMKYNYFKDFKIKENYTYSDGDHWSNFGEIYFGEKIFLNDKFKNLLKND